MREYFKTLFSPIADEEKKTTIDRDKKLQIATCALFVEMANADDKFDDDEKNLIITLMKSIFNLNDDEVKELLKLSEDEIKDSVSLYEFTEVVDAELNRDEKIEIIENLWRLILVDDKLHQYEDYFIRKIVANLHLSHSDMINAKIKIKKERE